MLLELDHQDGSLLGEFKFYILYFILFFIALIVFNNTGSIELMSDYIVLSGNYDELGKSKNPPS
ncbi:hypothetical protein [Xenorhabdus bovienii]|nr:hypothetical protein [Xenorhabdus bovienii]